MQFFAKGFLFSANTAIIRLLQPMNVATCKLDTRWWFETSFIFTPAWGNDPIWLWLCAYFSNGSVKKPPTSHLLHLPTSSQNGWTFLPTTAETNVRLSSRKHLAWELRELQDFHWRRRLYTLGRYPPFDPMPMLKKTRGWFYVLPICVFCGCWFGNIPFFNGCVLRFWMWKFCKHLHLTIRIWSLSGIDHSGWKFHGQ